jgi:hypothetical protein
MIEVSLDHLVNVLLTISIRVNVPVIGMFCRVTTGDDHEVQESEPYSWPLELAVRSWLERRGRQRLIELRP